MMLYPPLYRHISPSSIKPQGWIKTVLLTQAQGQAGKLDLFWVDVKDSAWVGGSAEGWERVPYWLDGFIPLAYLLDDEDMQKRADRYIDAILAGQSPDGWICPCPPEKRGQYDLWAYFLVLKVLVGYYEATEDGRIEEAIYRALKKLDTHIDHYPLFAWAQSRWYEGLIAIYWLYERTGDAWLLKLAKRLKAQGLDWDLLFEPFLFTSKTPKGRWSQDRHVVNNAMMLRGYALWRRMTNDEREIEKAKRNAEILDRYHGQPHGSFSGDECLAGLSASQGTELCSIVEYMYSCELLFEATGDPYWMDRLERLAFNALPAGMTADMWAHQYVQQVNQVMAAPAQSRAQCVYTTNGPEANMFGLEPEYGCCTVNQSQGFPKFMQAMVYEKEGGLAFGAYAPCDVHVQVDDQPVNVTIRTGYPFRDRIDIELNAEETVHLTLDLRVPSWAAEPYLQMNGQRIRLVPGSMHSITLALESRISISLEFPSRPILKELSHDQYALFKGALLFALPLPETRELVRSRAETGFPCDDYALTCDAPYAYAWGIDARDVGAVAFEEGDFGRYVFDPSSPPLRGRMRVYPINWPMADGALTPALANAAPIGSAVSMDFIPYGCTNLRLTALPLACTPDLIGE